MCLRVVLFKETHEVFYDWIEAMRVRDPALPVDFHLKHTHTGAHVMNMHS